MHSSYGPGRGMPIAYGSLGDIFRGYIGFQPPTPLVRPCHEPLHGTSSFTPHSSSAILWECQKNGVRYFPKAFSKGHLPIGTIAQVATSQMCNIPNRLSSTIDGNTECVHLLYSCIYVNSNSVSEKNYK